MTIPIYQAACDYADEAVHDPGSTLDLARSAFLAGTGEQASRDKTESDALRDEVKKLRALLNEAVVWMGEADEALAELDDDWDDVDDMASSELIGRCREASRGE